MVNDVRKVERLTRDTGVIVIRAVKFRHRFCFNDMACYICTVVYGNLIGGGGGRYVAPEDASNWKFMV